MPSGEDWKGICASCRSSQIMTGDGRQFIYCNAMIRPVTFRVLHCSEHHSPTDMSLGMMQEIAWRIINKKGQRKIGFVSPQEWERLKAKPESDDDPT